jgi:predicted dehydrogenase
MMQQIVQNIRTGETSVKQLPTPIAGAGSVLVASACSLISAGTERYVVELARKNLLQKAKERPDHVRRVVDKIKKEGLISVATQVRAKLNEPMPLGYSAAGVVVECGRNVHEFKPGDRVAVAGPHAEVVSVSRNLCARIPEGVTFEQASYTSVASIALEGVRLAKVTLGERVVVVGLGLIGQITVGLLKAQGCRVFGIDIDASRLAMAKTFGADEVGAALSADAVAAFTGQYGADAVILTASTSSNEPIEFAAKVARVKGRVVLVGVTGLNLPRPPFFEKELEFTVSSSLGPGRGEYNYEEKGVDYPFGHVRWTAQRNMQAVLDVIASGKLPVEKLTTHRYAIDQASEAYDVITSPSGSLYGVVIEYPGASSALKRRPVIHQGKSQGTSELHMSLVGAGNFARLVMLPLLSKHRNIQFRGICTANGMRAASEADQYGFQYSATEYQQILDDKLTNAVVISTRHHLHASMVMSALRAGKHVFVEKPLCIVEEELDALDQCISELGADCPILMVGFNRRYSPGVAALRDHFQNTHPLSVTYRFHSGFIPANSWTQDNEVGGGRIVGEASHAIDTCTAIVGSPPVRVFAESVAQARDAHTTDDRAMIVMRHANGSVSCVSYQAGGDRSGPSERIEVFGGGRSAVLDEWQSLELWQDGKRSSTPLHRDKGHAEALSRFVRALERGESWPVPWREELYSVSWASIMAVRSLREGFPMTYPW